MFCVFATQRGSIGLPEQPNSPEIDSNINSHMPCYLLLLLLLLLLQLLLAQRQRKLRQCERVEDLRAAVKFDLDTVGMNQISIVYRLVECLPLVRYVFKIMSRMRFKRWSWKQIGDYGRNAETENRDIAALPEREREDKIKREIIVKHLLFTSTFVCLSLQ